MSLAVHPLPSSLGGQPNDGGNLLIVDGKHPLKPIWESDSALRVAGPMPAKIFKQEKSVLGVDVSHSQ